MDPNPNPNPNPNPRYFVDPNPNPNPNPNPRYFVDPSSGRQYSTADMDRHLFFAELVPGQVASTSNQSMTHPLTRTNIWLSTNPHRKVDTHSYKYVKTHLDTLLSQVYG